MFKDAAGYPLAGYVESFCTEHHKDHEQRPKFLIKMSFSRVYVIGCKGCLGDEILEICQAFLRKKTEIPGEFGAEDWDASTSAEMETFFLKIEAAINDGLHESSFIFLDNESVAGDQIATISKLLEKSCEKSGRLASESFNVTFGIVRTPGSANLTDIKGVVPLNSVGVIRHLIRLLLRRKFLQDPKMVLLVMSKTLNPTRPD